MDEETRVSAQPAVPLPDASKDFPEQSEDVLFTQCIFGEARNQPEPAQIAMAWSVLNRLLYWRSVKEYGDRTWHGVLLHPGQYDCFQDERDKLLNPLHYESQQVWEHCYGICQQIMTHSGTDPISGATHYFDRSRDSNQPFWAKSPLMEHVCDVGDFRFYKYRNQIAPPVTHLTEEMLAS